MYCCNILCVMSFCVAIVTEVRIFQGCALPPFIFARIISDLHSLPGIANCFRKQHHGMRPASSSTTCGATHSALTPTRAYGSAPFS